MQNTSFHWNPGELDRLQLSIGSDGTGDTACETCGRWISAHDPEVAFCSPSLRKATFARELAQHRKQSPYRANCDLLHVIAEDRRLFAAMRRAYPKTTSLQVSTYGWVLRLQPDPSATLRLLDARCAPMRWEIAA